LQINTILWLFIFFVVALVVSLAGSLPQFMLISFTLKYILSSNEEIETKIELTSGLTFFYSILTATICNLLVTGSFLPSPVFMILSPYIILSALFIDQEATIFYNQDKIP
jgi:hypothetical protein